VIFPCSPGERIALDVHQLGRRDAQLRETLLAPGRRRDDSADHRSAGRSPTRIAERSGSCPPAGTMITASISTAPPGDHARRSSRRGTPRRGAASVLRGAAASLKASFAYPNQFDRRADGARMRWPNPTMDASGSDLVIRESIATRPRQSRRPGNCRPGAPQRNHFGDRRGFGVPPLDPVWRSIVPSTVPPPDHPPGLALPRGSGPPMRPHPSDSIHKTSLVGPIHPTLGTSRWDRPLAGRLRPRTDLERSARSAALPETSRIASSSPTARICGSRSLHSRACRDAEPAVASSGSRRAAPSSPGVAGKPARWIARDRSAASNEACSRHCHELRNRKAILRRMSARALRPSAEDRD